jgi:hypothetical protein
LSDTYKFSDTVELFIPADLSGLVVFLRRDYSTVFIELDLERFPELKLTESTLDTRLFLAMCAKSDEFSTIKRDMLSKSIIVVKH